MTNADPLPRIGAHIRKAPSIENGGKGSETRERAQMGASDLQASPSAEGDRQLWGIYIRRQRGAQGAWTGGAGVVRWGGRGRGNRGGPMKWVRVPERLEYDAPVGSNQPLWRPHRSSGTVASRPTLGEQDTRRGGPPEGLTPELSV